MVTSKGQAVTNLEELRKQLEGGYLNGDSMATLKWLLEEYTDLIGSYNMLFADAELSAKLLSEHRRYDSAAVY